MAADRIQDLQQFRCVPIHLLTSQQYDELARILAEPTIAQNLSGGSRAWTRKRLLDLRAFSASDAGLAPSARTHFYWIIFAQDDRERIVGIIGFHPTVSGVGAAGDLQIMYAIAREERGKGFARRATVYIMETMQAAICASEPKRNIWAIIREDNVASIRALDRSEKFAQWGTIALGRDNAMHRVFRAIN